MIRQELKKIWTPMRILLMIGISVLMIAAFLRPCIMTFHETDGADSFTVEMAIAKEWMEQYGYSISEEEYADAADQYRNIIAAIDESVSRQDVCAACGVSSYEEFQSYEQNAIAGKDGYDYEKYREMRNLIFEGTVYSELYIQEYKSMMEAYENASDGQIQILPAEVIIYTEEYLLYLMILCMILVFFIASPVMVMDRESGMILEQYSSKIGRHIYRKQYLSMLISVLFAEALLIAGGLAAWTVTETYSFVGAGLNSFLYQAHPSWNMTYGMMLSIFVLIMVLLGIGVGSIAFYISAKSSNAFSMLTKEILFAVLTGIYLFFLQDAFYQRNLLFRLIHIPGIEVWPTVLLAIAGIGLNILNGRRILVREAA